MMPFAPVAEGIFIYVTAISHKSRFPRLQKRIKVTKVSALRKLTLLTNKAKYG